LGEPRLWAALVIEAARIEDEDFVAALLDDCSPAAIEDLALQPLPPGGLWDPTSPPPPEPPPAPLRWRVFFNTAEARDRAATALREQFADLTIEPVDVADEDWAARSQRSLTAIRAGHFVVAPPWDIPAEMDSATTLIVIEPSRGFGTGHHASTRLCLQALSGVDVQGKRVLDLGTGSGVLAMAASLKGAAEVLAIDVDPDAIEAARESAALNALPVGIEFGVGDFRSTSAGLKPRQYEVVLANLTGGILMRSAATIMALVAPGGLVVMSGFDETDQQAVRDAFDAMHDVAAFCEDGWVGLVLKNEERRTTHAVEGACAVRR